ncbi:MAG: hypothetical protein CFE24_07075 [Flavobacterium sp. BFFFF2]|nr:MAG: hypothetical protein CFE24_07075 [Flavobacterium sp. BFFFF2]
MKRLVLFFLLFITQHIFAQEGTSSPYSFYGIGDVKLNGTAQSKAMGGMAVQPDSIHLNLQNPAFLSSLKWINYSVGFTYNTLKVSNDQMTENARRSTLDYFAFAFPFSKYGFSFGVMPYSSVGYKVQNVESNTTTQYTGKGGLNRAFGSFSYKVTPELSLGTTLHAYFGKIETSSTLFETGIQYGTKELNYSYMNGFSFTLGAAYVKKYKDGNYFSGSFTFTPKSAIHTSNERSIYTSDITVVNVPNTTLYLPSSLTFGGGYGKERKWFVGSEFSIQNSNELSNRYDNPDQVRFNTSYKIALGGYFIPESNAFSGYAKRMVYRGGLRYANTGLIINDTSIKDYAATAGLGFPLGGLFSNVNITAEYGIRGTTSHQLLQEQYVNFSVGLSLNDRWFVKRKYD